MRLPKSSPRACYSTVNRSSLPDIDRINSSYINLNIDDFRRRAFVPETPLHISERDEAGNIIKNRESLDKGLPAAYKWFSPPSSGNDSVLSHEYLSRFDETALPYELVLTPGEDILEEWGQEHGSDQYAGMISLLRNQSSPDDKYGNFHHFDAPLALFLRACQPGSTPLKRLYIAQAQIIDLPKELQDDLPTPRLVQEAGKGDVYDANIWLGIPPTYTPLHKDPNPNLFVQLGNSKRVRVFPPKVGLSLFRHVQQNIGSSTSATFRGDEMMQGPERKALDRAVWGNEAPVEGFEAVVNAGDAVFIPKGWWHSFKSMGDGVNASVNWVCNFSYSAFSIPLLIHIHLLAQQGLTLCPPS